MREQHVEKGRGNKEGGYLVARDVFEHQVQIRAFHHDGGAAYSKMPVDNWSRCMRDRRHREIDRVNVKPRHAHQAIVDMSAHLCVAHAILGRPVVPAVEP